MNKFEKLAELLGVPMDREFKVANKTLTHKFTSEGLMVLDGDSNKSIIEVNFLLENDIELLPWKPKEREIFYVVNAFNVRGYTKCLCEDGYSHRLILRDVVYQTEEEVVKEVERRGWKVEGGK